jgi:hypothetical protein
VIGLDGVREGRRLNKILREYDCGDGEDLRIIVALKNRYGPANIDFPLSMTSRGLVGLEKRAAMKDAGRTGNKVTDMLLERGRLASELEDARQGVRDIEKEIEELDVQAERQALKASQEAAKAPPPEGKKAKRKKADLRVVPT